MSRTTARRPVLLIDDCHEDIFLARRLLVRAGVLAPVVTIDHAEQAMAYLRTASEPAGKDLQPGIVFCDVRMPAVDGLELLRWLRHEGRLAEVPFYIMSGGDMDAEKQRSRELGAAGFLRKFPSPEEFKRLLAAAGLA